MRPPGTYVDIAHAIAAGTGAAISSTSIRKPRTAQSDNPALKTLTVLAPFFGVPTGLFGHDDAALVGLLHHLRSGAPGAGRPVRGQPAADQ